MLFSFTFINAMWALTSLFYPQGLDFTQITHVIEEKCAPYIFITAEHLEKIYESEEDHSLTFPDNEPSTKSSDSSWRENFEKQHTAQDMLDSDLFSLLPLTENEKKIITTIIVTMAEKNILKLGLMKRTLEKKGKRIHHVHPLRFLGYVFSTPHLKTAMYKIKKSGFKWDGFIDGLSKKMKEESNEDNLLPYVAGFCTLLDVNSDQVTHYIKKHDWEGLVRYLL